MPINDNLEAMAKQLYDYWFVQFDFPNEEGKPYKSSGGAMVWNEKLKREIPQGWSVLSVNDIAASVRGVSYTKEDMVDSNNGVLVLRGNNIQDNHLIYDSNVAYIPSSFVSEDQRIRPLDIIMTMSSGSKEHIGKSAMFQFASEDTFGAFLTKFTAKEHCAYLLFNLFNSQYFKAKIKSIACGTGINNLTNQTFDEIYIVTPEDELLLEFDKRQSQIFAEIGLIEKSNVELTKQRDELLPLLMNGQATVNYHLSATISISFDISVLFLNFTNGNSLYETISLDYQCFALSLHSKENTHGTIQEDKRHIQQRQRQGDKHARERFLAFFYKCTSTVQQAAFGNAWCYRGYKGKDISESK